MTAKKNETQDKTPPAPEQDAPEQDAPEQEVAVVPESKEDRALAKLKKGQHTPTRSVICKDNKIKGRGEPVVPSDFKGGKETFDKLVKKKRIFRV